MEKRVVKKTGDQMVIGSKRLIDPSTGEDYTVAIVEKNINTDMNFHKIWLADILHVLNSFGNTRMSILAFLLQNMRNEDNSISVTYKYIEQQTGISYKTIAITMKELVEANVISKLRTGLYMFNPDLIVKGRPEKRQRLMIEYNFNEQEHIPIPTANEQIEKTANKLLENENRNTNKDNTPPDLFKPANFRTDTTTGLTEKWNNQTQQWEKTTEWGQE